MAKKVLKSERYLVAWDRVTNESSLAEAKKNWFLHSRKGRYYIKVAPRFSGTFEGMDVILFGSKKHKGTITATIHSSNLKCKYNG